jgi:hypothetical protein
MQELVMLGLTSVGILHAASSFIALPSGVSALLRSGGIRLEDLLGRIYVGATVVACLSGLANVGLGGFGKPDLVEWLTIAALGFAVWPVGSTVLGPGWRYAVSISYATLLFFNSLSVDAPVHYILNVTFGVYSAGLIWEVWHLR